MSEYSINPVILRINCGLADMDLHGIHGEISDLDMLLHMAGIVTVPELSIVVFRHIYAHPDGITVTRVITMFTKTAAITVER